MQDLVQQINKIVEETLKTNPTFKISCTFIIGASSTTVTNMSPADQGILGLRFMKILEHSIEKDINGILYVQPDPKEKKR